MNEAWCAILITLVIEIATAASVSKSVRNLLLFDAFLLALFFLITRVLWEKKGVERTEEKFIQESMEMPADTETVGSLDRVVTKLKRDDSLAIVQLLD
jgi:hypothetical protein